MSSYAEHQKLLQRASLLVQSTFPQSRFFQRHVGLFYTKNKSPISIGIKGQADAYILLHYKGNLLNVEVEFKTGSATQTKEQKNWQKTITDLGGLYILCRNEQDIITEIKKKWPDI
jgi:hypothetical protein